MERPLGSPVSMTGRRLALVGAIGLSVALAACGTGRTMITAAPETKYAASSLTIQEGNSTVQVPPEVKTALAKQLEQTLHEKSGFARGTDLTLRYRFVQFAAGDRFQRWFWGGIGNAGEGSMTIETVFVDRAGRELAKTMTEGRIGSGFFGGAIDSAVEKAAQEIATYTVSNFR